ncbi:MAG: response regulator transcription factor [Chloroflexi bacterium]|nr:response regulator transcription factor [Chloroflexota bacterium]
MDGKKIGVLLADDHLMVRTGLRMIIDAQPDMKVVGEAKNGLEAIQMAEQVHPDVVVMDISMPSLGGLEATRRIKRQMDDAQVLMLTMHDNEQFFFQAIQAGANGYVTKTAPEWELLTAIRSVDQGNCYLNAGVTKLLVSDYLERIKRGERRQPDDLLTDREREILNLVAAGHSNREIAQILNISEHTVHNHRARLMEKLGVHNRLELLKYALRQGIITAET